MSVDKYLAELGSERPYQLVFGLPRRAPLPPAPEVPAILDRLMLYLCLSRGAAADSYVAIRSPVDVVLDIENGLVLHPAIAVVRQGHDVVRAERQIWGAPALVVEVLWPASARRIRTATLRWYRNYGVEECWLVDMRCARVEVLDFVHGPRFVPLIYRGKERIQSHVYPDSNICPVDIFAGIATASDIWRRSRGASEGHSR